MKRRPKTTEQERARASGALGTFDVHRGLLVYDKADPRHVGRITSVSFTAQTANVEWLETGWLSYRLPLRDLRRAKGRPRATECLLVRSELAHHRRGK